VRLLGDRPAAPGRIMSLAELEQAYLSLSGALDLEHALTLQAYRDGYAAAAAQFGDYEAAGYARAVADFKRAQHDHVRELRQHLAMWDGLRQRFSRPRPGDYPGREAAA
jgi:hypothetical protein